jgi:N-acetylmuramoyl-L-alanine amidase
MHWTERMNGRMPISRPVCCADLPGRMRKTGNFFAAVCILLAAAASTLAAQDQPAASSRFVVVLDAAHGGDDAGGNLGSQLEKSYNLALSVRLRSLLMARGFTVVTTREADTTVDSDRRAEIANHAEAQACLSLHAATNNTGSIPAVHVFISSLTPTATAHLVPWKTAQAAWIEHSLALAGMLNSALAHAGMTVTLGRTGLPGIDSMTCPAVAVEIAPGRPANASGASGSSDSDVQTEVAEALAAALVEWRSEDKGAQKQ